MHGTNYADVHISQRILYVDNDGDTRHAIVVDDCPDSDYVTLIHGGDQGELGEQYHSDVTTETSVYPHALVSENGSESHAFLPLRWEYDGEWEDVGENDE